MCLAIYFQSSLLFTALVHQDSFNSCIFLFKHFQSLKFKEDFLFPKPPNKTIRKDMTDLCYKRESRREKIGKFVSPIIVQNILWKISYNIKSNVPISSPKELELNPLLPAYDLKKGKLLVYLRLTVKLLIFLTINFHKFKELLIL